jgi:alkylation response protein AidB-like acyl-CoA dehydrogenase
MEAYLSSRNLRFVLFEWLAADTIGATVPYFKDFDKDAFEMSLDAAKQIADVHLFPYYREMDKQKAVCENGVTTTHPQLKVIIQSIADGGWIAAVAPNEYGGLQMPQSLLSAGLLTFYAANVNACYPFLTQGASNLIVSFGSEALKAQFLPNMFSGAWQGTMALTEPQAGSSLSDITASATQTDTNGTYKIKGQKIYISGGDHSAVENVVHLLLARIDGAPVGTKGISLFVVPKKRNNGGEWVNNDVITAGIYGKMGQKGYTAAHLMYGENDNCEGYLVGEPHKGLSYMFQMMNEARIGTGLVSAGAASAAYYASLKYAHERPQGRPPSNKDVHLPQTLIINHADVRRMLLFQKAVTEGSIALLLQCSHYADLSHDRTTEAGKNAHLLLELLTPIAKSYPSEAGILSVSAGMQVLGGAGYCDDFPLELIYRDIRVNAIYEGTTTIHGMDILGRKIMLENGKALQLFAAELTKTVANAQAVPTLQPFANQLAITAQKLQDITLHLINIAKTESPEVFLADATLYLEYFSLVVIAWVWLEQGIVATKNSATAQGESEHDFYASKLVTLQYFFEYELPKTYALHQRLKSSERLTLDLKNEFLV